MENTTQGRVIRPLDDFQALIREYVITEWMLFVCAYKYDFIFLFIEESIGISISLSFPSEPYSWR